MIIRKPTKIELKVENDQQDYDSFKERLNNERMRNNRQNLVRRDESLFSELMASDRLGSRSYNFGLRAINDLSTPRSTDFMTPQGQGEMRRNIYPPSGERYPRLTSHAEDDDFDPDRNNRFISDLLRGMGGDHDSSGRDDN